MDTPAVVALASRLAQQLQNQVLACTTLGSIAAQLAELLTSIGAKAAAAAAAATAGEWPALQVHTNKQIQQLTQELEVLLGSLAAQGASTLRQHYHPPRLQQQKQQHQHLSAPPAAQQCPNRMQQLDQEFEMLLGAPAAAAAPGGGVSTSSSHSCMMHSLEQQGGTAPSQTGLDSSSTAGPMTQLLPVGTGTASALSPDGDSAPDRRGDYTLTSRADSTTGAGNWADHSQLHRAAATEAGAAAASQQQAQPIAAAVVVPESSAQGRAAAATASGSRLPPLAGPPPEVPDWLLCPISRQPMTDPVVLAESGHTYEGEFIRTWLFHEDARRDPLTNQTLRKWPPVLVRNHALYKAVHDFFDKHPEAAGSLSLRSSGPASQSALAAARLQESPAGPSAPPLPPPLTGAAHVASPSSAASSSMAAMAWPASLTTSAASSSVAATLPASSTPADAASSSAAAASAAASDSAAASGSAAAAVPEASVCSLLVGRAFASLMLQQRTFFVKNSYKLVHVPYEHLISDEADCQAAATPLHWAARVGWAALARGLLEQGMLPDVEAEGETALCRAVANGFHDVAAVLVKFGADVDKPKLDGTTPLLLALQSHSHSREMVEMLLCAGADPNRSSGRDGTTPLLLALRSERHSKEMVQMLLCAGADPSRSSQDGTTPLVQVLLSGRDCEEMVARLLRAGAYPKLRNQAGGPLLVACKSAPVRVVELLLLYGASPFEATQSGRTALHLAATRGDLALLELLLEHGAEVDAVSCELPAVSMSVRVSMANIHNRGSSTPLHDAVANKHTAVVQRLLDHGANVNAVSTPRLETPLHLAAMVGDMELVMLLLQHGGDKSKTARPGKQTPLQYAQSFHGRNKQLRSMLK